MNRGCSFLNAVLATTCLCSVSVLAQDNDKLTFEEIVVTSQKRQQGLQDVPISVSVVSGEKIAQAGVQDLGDLSAFVANFQTIEDPIGDKVNIRGIQSGNNTGIEQSIGTYVDGVYRGRGIQSRFAFLDVERVEVLRGSQGTLFGKNTIGGALNITSAKPTHEFEGNVSASYNISHDDLGIDGALSGPLTETLRARIAWVYRDMNKGWIENQHYGEGSPQREEWAARASLDWDATDTTSVSFRYERGDFDVQAQAFATLKAGPLAAFGLQDNSYRTSNIGDSGFPALGFGPFMDIGSAGTNVGESEDISLGVETDLGGAGVLNILAANSEYNFKRDLDADFSPIPGLNFYENEKYRQKSLELRLVSPVGEKIEYIMGAYYQDYRLRASGDTAYNVPVFHGILNAGCAGAGVDPTQFLVNLGGAQQGDPTASANLFNMAASLGSAATLRSCVLSAALTDPASPTLGSRAGFNRFHNLDMRSETFAAFSQVTWNVTDRFRITGGLRYSIETKDALQVVYATDLGSDTPTNTHDFLLGAFGEAEAHTHARDDLSRKEKSLTWSIKAQYDVSDVTMVYASASTGFKAGGFNSFAMSANPSEAEFEDEEALTFEIGSKLRLDGGRGEVNVAAFYTEFDNLQTALFTGSTSFIVQNAASATTKGIEIDGRYRLTESITVSGSAGYLDFSYDSYPNAGCNGEQLLALREQAYAQAIGSFDPANAAGTLGGALLGALDAAQITLQNCSNPAGDFSQPGLNDLTGRTTEHAPKFNATLSVMHEMFIGEYGVTSVLDYVWQDKQYRQADLDPLALDNAYGLLNFSTAFGPVDGNWDISLLVKNITDTKYFTLMNDTPLFDGSYQFIPAASRSFNIRASYRF